MAKKQEAASELIERNLKELKKQDVELGAVWENIMDYWSYVNTEMEIQLDGVPEDLPEDNSLCIIIYPKVDSVVILTSDYHVARGSILFHSRFVLDAHKTGTDPIEIVANVGLYTGEKSYESFELQARGVRSVAENCGYFKKEKE